MVTCSHVGHLLPLLHDGELENPLRRDVIAHVAACAACTRALSLLERGRELLCQAIEEEVEVVDYARFWDGVAARLSDPPPPWAVRARLWRGRWRLSWELGPVRWAGAAAIALLVTWALLPWGGGRQGRPVRVAAENIENQAQIESIDAEAPVLFWNEPESNFTVIWVGDDEGDMP
jgi:hypothetical protein